MAGVELRGVTKHYGGAPAAALRDLSLHIADGEFMVFVGPSGCGKSTLLRVLAGLEPPSGGDVLIGGRVVNDVPPQRRNVAMVFQNYALYPHMSVRQNIAFPLRMMGLRRGEVRQRLMRVSAMLDLEPLLDRRPAALSGGQRQRVAMARALVRDPAVFLMDEPLSNLDAKLRVQVRGEILALQRDTGTTMAYVTHDQVEAMTLGQRVAVLNGGELQQLDTPQALYDAPANTFVAGFLGSPPMNLFPARVSDYGGVLTLTAGALRLPLAAGGRRWPALDRRLDLPLTAGLRPESIRLGAPAAPPTLQAVVTGVENLGHETLLYVELPGIGDGAAVVLAARCPAGTGARPGERLAMTVDPEGLHLFDERGRALQRR